MSGILNGKVIVSGTINEDKLAAEVVDKINNGGIGTETDPVFTDWKESSQFSLGGGTSSTGGNSIAIGYYSHATSMNAITLGTEANASGDRSISLGYGAYSQGMDGLALGASATVSPEAFSSVALGNASRATEPLTVSVGTGGSMRRIVNMLPGTDENDAVNVQQLNEALENVRFTETDPVFTAWHSGETLVAGNKRITGVSNGTSDTDAATVGQLNTAIDMAGSGYVSLSGGQTIGGSKVFTDTTRFTGGIAPATQTGSDVGSGGLRFGRGYFYDVYAGAKTGHDDGKTGVFLQSNGGISLQHATAPYIDFYANGSTVSNGRLIWNNTYNGLNLDVPLNGVSLTAAGNGNSFLSNDGTYKEVAAAETDPVFTAWHSGETLVAGNKRISGVSNGTSDADAATVGQLNGYLPLSGNRTMSGTLNIRASNAIRMMSVDKGFILRPMGGTLYFLVTNDDDPTGDYTAERPLSIVTSTGTVDLWYKLKVSHPSGIESAGPVQCADATAENQAATLGQLTEAIESITETNPLFMAWQSGPGITAGLNASNPSENGIALGQLSNTSFNGSIAIGYNANASNDTSAAIAIGGHSTASGNLSMVYGSNSRAEGTVSVAIGHNTVAAHDSSVALGSGSSTDGILEVSVGNADTGRKITNVADGVKDTDAATVGQLKAAMGSGGGSGRKIYRFEHLVMTDGSTTVDVSDYQDELNALRASYLSGEDFSLHYTLKTEGEFASYLRTDINSYTRLSDSEEYFIVLFVTVAVGIGAAMFVYSCKDGVWSCEIGG